MTTSDLTSVIPATMHAEAPRNPGLSQMVRQALGLVPRPAGPRRQAYDERALTAHLRRDLGLPL